MLSKTKTALLSCTDKTGLVVLARFLLAHSVRILASGGTSATLQKENIPVIDVSEWTGSPEIFGGRVKTLHPKIHGPILFRRNEASDRETMETLGWDSIDFVVVNLYRFSEKRNIEAIDVGGPTMLRAAAKNYESVTVLSDPSQYSEFMELFKEHQGITPLSFRKKMAHAVFKKMSAYDGEIANFLKDSLEASSNTLPVSDLSEMSSLQPAMSLRYGENPQQAASLFTPHGELPFHQYQGKELSYNNLADMEIVQSMVLSDHLAWLNKASAQHYCVVVKHQNPCGLARGQTPTQAWGGALAGDPEAAFGGIVAFSGEVDESCALKLKELFLEVILAPSFHEKALELFESKKNLRVVRWNPSSPQPRFRVRSWSNGLLVQSDDTMEEVSTWKQVTSLKPTPKQFEAATLAWYASRFVKSNAIVVANPNRIIAVGAGQMSRVDSIRIITSKLKNFSESLEECAVASDAFFPFRDSVDLLASAGLKCIVQPMGSVKDAEVLQACEEKHISMIATGRRHFYH